jgi:hypothetical protein
MSRRRFSILVVALVALNLVLWLAPQGLALREAFVNQLFGPRMIRAEVVVRGAGGTTLDYRIDRGVITSVTPTALMLREQDGTTTSVTLVAGTQVTGRLRITSVEQLRRNLRVLVFRQANGAAELVQVEGRAKALP